VDGLRDMGHVPTSVEVAESIAADQRALLVETSGTRRVSAPGLEALLGDDVQSIVTLNAGGTRAAAGSGAIVESLSTVTRGRVEGELRRHPESFFQGNRFLIAELVSAVVQSVPPDGDVLDLYAGVGLFALAADSAHEVIAVEGHPASGTDLETNARASGRRVTAVVSSVEHYLARGSSVPPTVIVDPPRTGLSREALAALIAGAPKRLVYVSCDPATLARDTRGLLDSGYQLLSVTGFDLFPNTPHVEALAIFDRAR
jgi:tRNA/tmRNA/rRNA uracil-C5-methylase (TrmA/RlmC/RlmD family)